MTSRPTENPLDASPFPFRGVYGQAIRSRMPAIMPRRVREIKRRITEGYYDRPEIVAETARRLLRSRDLPLDGD